MVSKKIFWENPYQEELITTITEKDGGRVQLAEKFSFLNQVGRRVTGVPLVVSK